MPVGRMRGNGNTKRSISSERRKQAIKPSRQARNLLMAHMHTHKFRETKETVKQIKALAFPFIPGFVQRCPPFTSPQRRQHFSD